MFFLYTGFSLWKDHWKILFLSVILPPSILVAEKVDSHHLPAHSEDICTLLVDPYSPGWRILLLFVAPLALRTSSPFFTGVFVECLLFLWAWQLCGCITLFPLPFTNYLGILLLPVVCLPCPVELGHESDGRVNRHAVNFGGVLMLHWDWLSVLLNGKSL